MSLVDKDALVAEIEKRKHRNVLNEGAFEEDIDILSFINTLEVKEVDLDYIRDKLDEVVKIYKPDGDFGWGTLYNVATHFFELGLKAQKGK